MDKIDKTKSMKVIIKDKTDEIVIGSAMIHLQGDKVLDTLRVDLEDLKLLFKKGDRIYERG